MQRTQLFFGGSLVYRATFTIPVDRESTRYFLTLTSSVPCVIDWQCANWHQAANQRSANDTLDK